MAGKRKAAATQDASAPKAPRKTNRKKQAAATVEATPVAASATATAETPERGMSHVDEMLIGLGARPVATDGAPGAEADAAPADELIPEIDPLATFWTELDLNCRHCAIIHYVNFCSLLNAEESPHLVERAKANQFNYKRCPVCKRIEYVQHPWTFYDPQRQLVVQIRPEWEWHAGGGEEWYAARLEDLFDKWSEHDVKLDVCFGPEQFIEKYLQDGVVSPES